MRSGELHGVLEPERKAKAVYQTEKECHDPPTAGNGRNDVFERHEYDLHCSLPVNIAQAALGTSIELMTFDGMQTVKVPEGSQPGARLRLKGLGVPHVNSSSRGDLFVHLAVKVPPKLSREQRRLMEQLGELLPTENAPEEKSLLDKVKDYFL